MPYTDKELEKLRSELPRGSAQIIAERTGYKVGTVRNVLSGLSNNNKIILTALEIATGNKEVEVSTKETIASL